MGERGQLGRVGLAGDQRLDHRPAAAAHDVGQNRLQLDVGFLQRLLHNASTFTWASVAKAASISPSSLAFKIWSSTPLTCAASCTALKTTSVSGLSGLTSRPITLTCGTSS